MSEETEVLDLHGEKCPDTFVYTKIKLEELAYDGGGLLKVLLDHPPAAENIPRSLRDERIGYEVLEVKNVGGEEYELLLRAPAVEE
ncbi:MAG: sulfurtransferase TusA family protein [Candidatus Hydrothermarchaeales archaeon]